jgi:hypothetical protein
VRWRGRVGFPRAAGRVEPAARRALLRARAATASRHASAGVDAGVSGLLALVARADASAAQLVRVERAVLHGDVSYTRQSPLVRGRWNQVLIARTLAKVLSGPGVEHGSAAPAPHMVAGSTRRGTSRDRKYPFYPLISYVFTFPKHLHRFLRGEARTVPVRPPLESRQGAVLGRSARRNGVSKWRQTLQTCGGDLDEQAESF